MPTALVAVFGGFFTGLGVTRTVMWINAVGLVVNVIFDYLFIFGRLGFPAMGIAGAGYATVLANWASASSVPISLLRTSMKSATVCAPRRWNKDLVRRYIRYGLPSGLNGR